MPILQKKLIVEKFKAIARKDPMYIFRGMKIVLTPVKHSIDVYYLNLEQYPHRSADLCGGEIKNKSGQEVMLEILSKDDLKCFDDYLKFKNEHDMQFRDLETLLNKGCHILLLYKEGKIAGAGSLGVNREFISSHFLLELVLDPDAVYFFDLYVPVPYRRQGIGYLLLKICVDFAIQKGLKHFISAIYSHNQYSIDMSRHLGMRKIAAITSIDQFFTRRYRVIKVKTSISIPLQFRLPDQKIIKV